MERKTGKPENRVDQDQEQECTSRMSKSHGSTASTSTHVTVKFQIPGLNDVDMKIKKDLQLGKAMRTYSKQMGLQHEALRFTFDGKRINETLTASDLSFEDGDVIDAWSEQFGGDGC